VRDNADRLPLHLTCVHMDPRVARKPFVCYWIDPFTILETCGDGSTAAMQLDFIHRVARRRASWFANKTRHFRLQMKGSSMRRRCMVCRTSLSQIDVDALCCRDFDGRLRRPCWLIPMRSPIQDQSLIRISVLMLYLW